METGGLIQEVNIMARRKVWTDEEDKFLIKHWGTKTIDELVSEMERHRLTILKKAKELGLREPRSKKWTEKEIKYLETNYKTKTAEQIAEDLNRSVWSVRKSIQQLNIKKGWTYRRVDKDGYIEIVLGSSIKEKEHRLVYSEFLGRKLGFKEYIHHIDFNKQNNDIENLILLSPSLHNSLHNAYKSKNYQRLSEIYDNLLEHDKPKYEKWLVLIRYSLLS